MENSIQNKEHENITKSKVFEGEIDIVEVVQKLWRNRKFILIVIALFSIVGLIVSVSTLKYYTASCTIISQSGQNSSGGSLSGLAAMAGINISNLNSGAGLSPIVYPKIMSNVNFQKELIFSKLHFNNVKEPISLYEYYTDKKYRKFNLLESIKKFTIGLPNVLIGLVNNVVKSSKGDSEVTMNNIEQISNYDSTSIKSLTSQEKNVSNIVNGNLTLNLSNKEGFITLTANMPEPLAAAELVQKGVELLQKYITEFKINKVASNLEFVEKSYDIAKSNFEEKQWELAGFRDSNKSFSSSVAKTQEERLMSEYNLLLGIYTELAKQKEQAKIAVTETTPILTVIEPIVIPLKKANSNWFMKILIYSIFGFIAGVVLVISISFLEENFFPNIKKSKFIPRIE